MAIYHLSVSAVSRSAGRSATAAAAYRDGSKITDERTGEIHDYRRKSGVEAAHMVLPPDAGKWAEDPAKLWNAAELAEKRKDACVAREVEVSLPAELTPQQREKLALRFAQEMARQEGCAVGVAIHAPGKEGDNRNHHAHMLRTTRKVEGQGMGAKLDTEKAGRNRKQDLEKLRERWAQLVNDSLQQAGHEARVDHRSLAAQGIEREPTVHMGPKAAAMQRRGATSMRQRQWLEHKRQQDAKKLAEARKRGAADIAAMKLRREAQQKVQQIKQQQAAKQATARPAGRGGQDRGR